MKYLSRCPYGKLIYDFILGSATSAHLAIQLAKLAGLKVAVVVDKARHGLRISNHSVIRPDLLVDSHDPSRAVEIIKANTGGQVHLGLDTRGRESATHLLQALSPSTTPLRSDTSRDVPLSPPSTPDEKELVRAHLVGLTGLPKGAAPEATSFHAVPIKLFHEVPQVGVSLTSWLGQLLKNGLIVPPDIVDIQNGLGEINAGLDRMRRGEIRGGKLVVRI